VLTRDESFEGSPQYSPDGRHIIFTSSRSGNGDIYRMTQFGNNPQPITSSLGENARPDWQPRFPVDEAPEPGQDEGPDGPGADGVAGGGEQKPRNAGACTITGTPGNDVLIGTPKRDVVCGLGGNDVIQAGRGSDVVRAGAGDDRVNGGRGNDLILGRAGRDRINGQRGADIVKAGTGDDELHGGPGRDRVFEQSGNDTFGSKKGGGASSRVIVASTRLHTTRHSI
jgi:Ca2+-binding RTX toxin-like protein